MPSDRHKLGTSRPVKSFGRMTCQLRFALLSAIASLFGFSSALQAQSIVPTVGDAGTIVTPAPTNPQQLDITGGTQTGTNLFHGFQRFGLNSGEVANFQVSPTVQTILSRVSGGNASAIDGLIRVTGGPASLVLLNPAGIIFGANARLDVPAAFTATTANGIGFANGWFNATGQNSYAQLSGDLQHFGFTTSQPGAIVNAGDLSVVNGQSLTLLGGTIVNTGRIETLNGTVTLAAVSGEQLVRVSQTGSLLSFDLPLATKNAMNPAILDPLLLPDLLTGNGLSNATGVTVENGIVRLTGSDMTVNAGDVVANRVTAGSAVLSADRDLKLNTSQLVTSQDLTLTAKETVRVRDSSAQPVMLSAGGNLTMVGQQGIDILALSHPQTSLQSGGNLTLISDGLISGDAHFQSGGMFSLLNTRGGAGNFTSLYDPIISAVGDVVFGDYVGPALKVEAQGSITAGKITITGPDTTLPILPNWQTTGNVGIATNFSAGSPTPVAAPVVIDTSVGDTATLSTQTTFAAQAGQQVSFDWNFLTEEFTANNAEKDRAIVTLTRQGGAAQIFQLANFDDTAVNSVSVSGNFYARSSGVRTFTTPILTSGNYSLAITVEKQGFNPGDSGLLVSNVSPVPIQISDTSLLAASPSLILRAGVTTLQNPPNVPRLNVPTVPTNFTSPGKTTPAGITVGAINETLNLNFGDPTGVVILSAPGPIAAAVNGEIRAGSVFIQSGGEIRTGGIRTASDINQQAYSPDGSVTLKNTDGRIVVDSIRVFLDGDITVDAFDGFQARKTFPIRSVTETALTDSPASIVTRGKISIQHGGAPLQAGLGVERDATGQIVFRAVGGARSGERVFFRPGSPLRFNYGDGTLVEVPAVINAVPFNPDQVADSVNYTAGAIFIGNGFDATLYGAFQDQLLGESGNISIAAVPRPPKPVNPNNPNNPTTPIDPTANSDTVAKATDAQTDRTSTTNALCAPVNQTVAINRGGDRTAPLPAAAATNPCPTADQGEQILTIDPVLNPTPPRNPPR
jgi:filamentous hemagglutinin family protein